MEDIIQKELRERYDKAVESFINKLRPDTNIIAVIISGSVAYDVVWEKSDIDTTVIVRDQQLAASSYCIIEDGITINVNICTRSEFKRGLEGSIGGLFRQSYYAKGKMLYSTDESLTEFFEEEKEIGDDDAALTLLEVAGELVSVYNKCRKWLYARKDPAYAQYFLIRAAEAVAAAELVIRREPVSRESIQKACRHNPELMRTFYNIPMSRNMTAEELAEAIAKLGEYIDSLLEKAKKPVIDYMSDGEIKTMSLLAARFHSEAHFLEGLFDYMADKGLIERVSQTIRITPKSKRVLEELAFLYVPDNEN